MNRPIDRVKVETEPDGKQCRVFLLAGNNRVMFTSGPMPRRDAHMLAVDVSDQLTPDTTIIDIRGDAYDLNLPQGEDA